ncbi:hypothetical protein ACF061_24475 [Streptomyces sp. NPDC015220]|uniref:hypothetical protein n=1 Tax=Streptomyces sp. NPDC015220 TaxID=3364947 RepID=UPI0036F9E040
MIDWSLLKHAYGTAEDIPVLFDRLGTGPSDEVWSDLWSRLCHQGSVYSASFAALAPLADLGDKAGKDGDNALILAGAIVAGADEGTRARHMDEIEALRLLAHGRVREPADPDVYVYLLQAAMAFDGVPVWSECLEGLADEEYEVSCPECDMGVLIAIGEAGCFSAVGDYEPGDSSAIPLRPALPQDLEGPARQLYEAAREAGVGRVAAGLTHLFGNATCAECGTEFSLSEQVADQY